MMRRLLSASIEILVSWRGLYPALWYMDSGLRRNDGNIL